MSDTASSGTAGNGGPPQAGDGRRSVQSLRPDLGLPIAVAVVVGSVIGSGIFFKPGKIAADVGHFPLILSVWVGGGLVCLLGGLCFAELGAMFPQAGGLYVYLREAFGRLAAFLFGWIEIMFAKPASIGALAVAFVESLVRQTEWSLSTVEQIGLMALLIGGLAWINVVGVRWGGRVQFAVTLVKAGFLAALGLLPFVLELAGHDAVRLANYASTTTPLQTGWANQTAAAFLAVMWAYNGWHAISPLAEEVREPQRNVPRALLWGIGILAVLYVGANIAYHAAMPMSEMAAAGKHAARGMAEKLLGNWGGAAMTAVLLCSTFGAINTGLLETPRVAFAMGRDGVFFRSLGLVHVNYGTPSVSIVVTAAMSLLTVVAVAAAKGIVGTADPGQFRVALVRKMVEGLQKGEMFDLLTNFVVFAMTIFFVLCVIAIFVLRWRRPELPRPYRTPGYPWVPLAFLGINIPFLAAVYGSNPVEAWTGLGLIAIGAPVYFAFRQVGPRA